MKIISNFKDYYDHLVHAYGVDEKVIYVRKELTEGVRFKSTKWHKTSVSEVQYPQLYVEMKGFDRLVVPCEILSRSYHEIGSNYISWVVVCGRAWPVLHHTQGIEIGTYRRIGEPDFAQIFDPKKHEKYVAKESRRWNWMNSAQYVPGTYTKQLETLCKKVGHPIFTFPGGYRGDKDQLEINPHPVNLGNLGLAARYPAEHIYQDISYFLLNVLKESPDMAPPSVMSDVEKIEQHGFDKKVSFRHRKN